ncbi:MAG TPA: hypothetical protein VGM54_06015 [Chthoniobacter sp.]
MSSPSRYKIRFREAAGQPFRDGSDWCSCNECILIMRSQFAANPTRDFQVVDESGLVIATTLEEATLPRTCGQN